MMIEFMNSLSFATLSSLGIMVIIGFFTALLLTFGITWATRMMENDE